MRFAACLFVLVSVSLWGCGKSKEQSVGDAETSEETTPKQVTPNDTNQPSTTTQAIATGLEPHPDYPIPNLDPEALLKYINQLARQEPRGDSREAFFQDQIHRSQSRLIAADRIILSENVNDGLIEAAVRAKLDALRLLGIMDSKEWLEHFRSFVTALKERDNKRHALMARVSEYEFELDQVSLGHSDDPSNLLSRMQEVLDDENAGESEFLITQNGALILDQNGFAKEATQVLNLVGNRFADSTDAKLSTEAKDLLDKTAFREKVFAAMNGGKPEIRSLFIAIRDLLQDKDKLTLQTLVSTLNAGQMLEFNGNFSDAKKVFGAIKKAFAGAEESVAEQAKRSVQYAERRLNVIGNDIEIEGIQMDGSPFDWSKLKGKVVLVDFWRAGSAPWQSEVSNLKAVYDRFHQDGFEVVGVNLDTNQDRPLVYDYLRQARLPWVTVVDENVGGFGNPNAIRYGVEAVPFVLLVGRDGKVSNIHVRGPKLSKRVEELIGMPSSKNAQKSGKPKL